MAGALANAHREESRELAFKMLLEERIRNYDANIKGAPSKSAVRVSRYFQLPQPQDRQFLPDSYDLKSLSMSDLFDEPAKRNLALRISRQAAAITASPEENGLPGSSNHWPTRSQVLQGIRGALVVAYDEEESPLTCGSQGLDLQGSDTDSQLEILVQMKKAIPPGRLKPSWFEIDRSFFITSGEKEILALPVQSNAIAWGLIVAQVGDKEPSASQSLAALASRARSWQRQSRMRSASTPGRGSNAYRISPGRSSSVKTGIYRGWSASWHFSLRRES